MLAVSPFEARAIASVVLPRLRHRAETVPPPPLPSELQLRADIETCAIFPRGFMTFLKYWRFKNRDTGAILTFANPWPGQVEFAHRMITDPWLFALKAGKLGFTELECAWDGYVATFGPPNSRIHLFSKEFEAAKELLGWVRFGLQRLPEAFGVSILMRERGGDTLRSIRLRVDRPGLEPYDVRTVYAYATSINMGIDQVCIHAHIDEWAHMDHPKDVWGTVQTTVSPIGTCHIVTRGAGLDEFVQSLWTSAQEGTARLKGFFAPWYMRPDRDADWYEQEAAQNTSAYLAHFAPETPDDAFLDDDQNDYVALEHWDACKDESLGLTMMPGDKTPIVIGVDAGVVNDNFAIVAVSRHPQRHNDPAVRAVKVWKPDDFPEKRINFDVVENFIRLLCQGGCVAGHAQTGGFKRDDCEACQEGLLMPGFTVFEMCYDPHQLEGMAQKLRRDRVVMAREFSQQTDRAKADEGLRTLIIWRRFSHNGDPTLREHIGNANAKTQRDEESKLRMVKKAPHRKIDAAVACSMAVGRVMYLNIPMPFTEPERV